MMSSETNGTAKVFVNRSLSSLLADLVRVQNVLDRHGLPQDEEQTAFFTYTQLRNEIDRRENIYLGQELHQQDARAAYSGSSRR